jgi:hypothetical protein
VQRLQDLAVEIVGERGVAPDAEDANGAVDDIELFDRLED